MNWHTVLASREGLEGHGTSVGLVIRKDALFVALPSVMALWKTVVIRYGAQIVIAPVLDVGPWNEEDNQYVFGSDNPLAAVGVGKYRNPTNEAGIDLSDGITNLLDTSKKEWGLRYVEWSFISITDIIY